MKRIKILIAFTLVFASLLLSSCSFITGLLPEEVAYFTADYDYGFNEEGKAKLLLSYCELFFDPDDYGMTPFVAGDTVKVTFRGEILIQESYPGRVVTKNAEISSIEKTDANTSRATVIRGEDGINLILTSDTPIPRLVIAIRSENLISSDMTFRPLTAEDEGLEVFVSFEAGDGVITVFAIYDYLPR
jgi:hypothetical protein